MLAEARGGQKADGDSPHCPRLKDETRRSLVEESGQGRDELGGTWTFMSTCICIAMVRKDGQEWSAI